LDIDSNIIQRALKSFKGVACRLDYHGTLTIGNQQVILFDDYGHHPNEIIAVFESLRNTYQNRLLVVIFQPPNVQRWRMLFASVLELILAMGCSLAG
jgi:UDP-N-acetylmuramate--alanine ligase